MTERIILDHYGQSWIAHRDDGHDCVDDAAPHGVSDHPVAALRQLLKND